MKRKEREPIIQQTEQDIREVSLLITLLTKFRGLIESERYPRHPS